MAVIGIELAADQLVLTKGRDFRWAFENLDEAGEPIDYPAGALYFEFPTIIDGLSSEPVKWPFTIAGSLATIKKESTEVAGIPGRSKWQLVFLADGEAAGGEPIARGTVKVQE